MLTDGSPSGWSIPLKRLFGMSTRISTNLDSLRGLLSLRNQTPCNRRPCSGSRPVRRLTRQRQSAGLIASNSLGLQMLQSTSQLRTVTWLQRDRTATPPGLGRYLLNRCAAWCSRSQLRPCRRRRFRPINRRLTRLSVPSTAWRQTSFAGRTCWTAAKRLLRLSLRQTPQAVDFSINQALFGSASSITVDAQVVTAAKQGKLTYNAGNLSAATTLQVSGAKGSQVLFFGAGSSYTNIATAVNANTDATGVTASITTAAVASTAALDNSTLNFSGSIDGAGANDKVAFTTNNSNVTVTFVVAGNSTARSVGVVGNAITVNLATDANGLVSSTETANSVTTTLNANASANALVTAYSGATVEGTGAGVLAAAGAASINTASNIGDLLVTDARQDAGASDTAVTINFVKAGNNTARSISVNGTAITVNLATDSTGNVATTETATLKTAINADAQAGWSV